MLKKTKTHLFLSIQVGITILLGIHSFSAAELLVDLHAADMPFGPIASWPNKGSLGGSFTAQGNPMVEVVNGKKAISFDGNDSFVSTFNVPDSITGNNSYTVAVWAYNPSIASEECMVNWAKRGTFSRAAQLNYGTNASYGAVTHWGGDDMGFDGGVPSPGQWHHIAVTYQGGPGSQETVYVNGQRNAIEFKTLNLWGAGFVYLGCSIESNERTRVLWFSGSLAQVQIYDTELSADQIKGLVTPIALEHTDGDTTVSESGDDDMYMIVLGIQPSSDVSVVISSDDGRTQTNVSSVVFTEANWMVPQSVTVSAIDNQLVEGTMRSVLMHTVSSADATFDGLSLELEVNVLDNDRLGDMSNDGEINLQDMVMLAQNWMNDCLIDDFCGGADLSGLIGLTANPGNVDMKDLSLFSTIWQQGPILITEFMASNGKSFVTMVNGQEDDPDWIELYNAGKADLDLNGWYLTDNLNNLTKWRFPSVVLGAGRYLVVFASGQETDGFVDDLGYLHTRFNLSAAGEDLAVVEPDGKTISHFWRQYPEQVTNYSYGLRMQTLQSGYFDSPTPGATNHTTFDGFVADTNFSRDRGFYTMPFEVEITCPTPDAVIRYTTDGSMPTETGGIEYTGPITISKTTCLRARAFKTGLIPTNTDTQTYLFLEDFWTQSRPQGYPTATYDAAYPLDYEIDQDVIGPDNLFGDVYRDTYIADLKAIPAMSIVMNVEDLFGIEKGIYANSIQEGELWERAASVEMMDAVQGGLFQVDCAIRLQGGYSRNAFESPKHNFRFIFKRPYGPPKLNYKLFPDSDVEEFDQLIVRTPCHDSWLTRQTYFRNEGLYASDGWHREIHRRMGHFSVHGRWVHLYLNGLYWGIFEVVERPNASFAASYHGGEKEEYDCISSFQSVRDGTADAWNAMNSIAAGSGPYGSISNPQAYGQIQEYLDVTNLADYIILNIYSAISDWPGWNYYACRKREPGAHFKFYCWDSEASLMSNRLYYNKLNEFHTGIGGAGTLYAYLVANQDFCLTVADRLHKHLHNGGALTPENAAAVYQAQLNRVAEALGPESARWGDAWESNPLTRADWLNNQQWLFSTFFPQRGEIILGFFRDKGVYPQTDPPNFSRYTGYAAPDDMLIITNPNPAGAIYYTLDSLDPRQTGLAYNGPLTLEKSIRVKARVLNGGEWSALTEAVFAVGPVVENLRITEIMYHPAGGSDNSEAEWLELQNIGSETINLNRVRFTEGIDYEFGDIDLAPGHFLVLAKNIDMFNAFNPDFEGNIVWGYEGMLSNSGERIRLEDALGTTIEDLEYKDGWYPVTNGGGFSLTVIDAAGGNDLSTKSSWKPSSALGGSPGQADTGSTPLPGSIVINEILAHSHGDADWIELYNTTDQPINIGGWYISDSGFTDDALKKYQIPAGTIILPYGYVVFYEGTDFTDFAFSANGETAYLTSAVDGQLGSYRISESFGASPRDIAFGRYYKASTDSYNFVLMSTNTPGAANAYPFVGPLVISEIMYHPPQFKDAEYVELLNISNETVPLYDAAKGAGWKFTDDGGFEFYFPAGSAIAPGERILIVKDLTIFASEFTAAADTQVFEWGVDGNLSNSGEKIELSMPGDMSSAGTRYYIRVDRVVYSDGSHPVGADPWPAAADGNGHALHRIDNMAYGNDVSNWTAAAPSPGG